MNHVFQFDTKVAVRRRIVDWNDPEESVLEYLKTLWEQGGVDKDCIYVNPMYSVESEHRSVAFFRKAQAAQADWLASVRKTLNNKQSRKLMRASDERRRLLAWTGVLFLGGEWFKPHRWSYWIDGDLTNGEPEQVDLSRH